MVGTNSENQPSVTQCDDLHIEETDCAPRTPFPVLLTGDGVALPVFLFIPLSFPIVLVPADNEYGVSRSFIIVTKTIHLLPSISFCCFALQPIDRFFCEANVASQRTLQFILSPNVKMFH